MRRDADDAGRGDFTPLTFPRIRLGFVLIPQGAGIYVNGIVPEVEGNEVLVVAFFQLVGVVNVILENALDFLGGDFG